ncbi:hypothetical protein [Agaribacterium sp. ZY112]|uniref:hypothetical protein n=1 Tax=Agaribacterium sp. ZY112 TaxID=3233574 RepID=UPI0035239BAE
MITYRYEKEKEIAKYYAVKLSDERSLSILDNGFVSNSEEAVHLSTFFWRVVDELVSDSEKGNEVCGEAYLEEWSELIMASFRAYLRSSGYEKEWNEVSDNA